MVDALVRERETATLEEEDAAQCPSPLYRSRRHRLLHWSRPELALMNLIHSPNALKDLRDVRCRW